MLLRSTVLLISVTGLVACATERIETADEFVQSYKSLQNYPGYGKAGYMGTDAGYHHFLIRPVDAFVVTKVPSSQVSLSETLPLRGSGSYHYLIDPSRSFQKVSETAALRN